MTTFLDEPTGTALAERIRLATTDGEEIFRSNRKATSLTPTFLDSVDLSTLVSYSIPIPEDVNRIVIGLIAVDANTYKWWTVGDSVTGELTSSVYKGGASTVVDDDATATISTTTKIWSEGGSGAQALSGVMIFERVADLIWTWYGNTYEDSPDAAHATSGQFSITADSYLDEIVITALTDFTSGSLSIKYEY